MILIGLDGASPKVVFNWANKGLLPNLSKLLSSSTYGTLWSISTSSAACWTSHLTGVRPRKSGIESFLKNGRLVRTWDITLKTYPEILSEQGLRVGLMNVPITYPPLELDGGFCVGGQLTPLNSQEFTRPINLRYDLEDYEIDVQYEDRRYSFVDDDLQISLDQLRTDVLRVESKRMQNALNLMEIKEWDLFCLLITGTDSLQHYFWHELEYRRPEETAIFELYSHVDRFIGEIRRKYSEETLLIFSDHGFQRDYWGRSGLGGVLVHRLKGALGRLLPNFAKQNRAYARAFDLFTFLIALMHRHDNRAERSGGTLTHTGNHDRKGIWIMSGKNIKKHYHRDAGFLDLNPLIMHLMGITIPVEYDGTFLEDVFEKPVEPKYADVSLTMARTPLESEEEISVMERLAALGYIEMVEGKNEEE